MNSVKTISSYYRRQRGISLLEVMLVLIITAVLMMAIMTYYYSAQRTKKINQAIQLIEQVLAAADNYRDIPTVTMDDGVPTMDYDDQFAFTHITTSRIVRSGFIPQQYIRYTGGSSQLTTPWFGESRLTIVPYTSSSIIIGYTVELSGIPSYACETLASQLTVLDKHPYESVSCKGVNLFIHSEPVSHQ